jgi:Carboxypeptidase regulatory-like domain/TonB dependent receptor-like, beta-barrel
MLPTQVGLLVLLTLSLAASAGAQAVTGTILGTVSDATGGALESAVLTITHTPTGISRSVTTDRRGEFVAPLLATGMYTLRVEAAGFKAATVTGIEVGVDRKARVDLALEAPYTERRPELSAYVQDDLRLSDRLTLNLGLRWDLFVPYVEDDDRQSNFDTSTGQFVVAAPDATINGVRVGRYLQTYSRSDFAPRLGFAYIVRGDGRTVLRGGFGKFWNTPLTGTGSSKGQNPPFLLAQVLTNSSPFVPGLTFRTRWNRRRHKQAAVRARVSMSTSETGTRSSGR